MSFARAAALAVAAVLALAACSKQTTEERARATAEKIMKSMVDVEGIALEQKVDPAVVEDVQRNLSAINEYQGEINGKLDSVTVNAIQAFQRTVGCSTMEWWARAWEQLLHRCITDNGIITKATRSRLAAAAAQAKK